MNQEVSTAKKAKSVWIVAIIALAAAAGLVIFLGVSGDASPEGVSGVAGKTDAAAVEQGAYPDMIGFMKGVMTTKDGFLAELSDAPAITAVSGSDCSSSLAKAEAARLFLNNIEDRFSIGIEGDSSTPVWRLWKTQAENEADPETAQNDDDWVVSAWQVADDYVDLVKLEFNQAFGEAYDRFNAWRDTCAESFEALLPGTDLLVGLGYGDCQEAAGGFHATCSGEHTMRIHVIADYDGCDGSGEIEVGEYAYLTSGLASSNFGSSHSDFTGKLREAGIDFEVCPTA